MYSTTSPGKYENRQIKEIHFWDQPKITPDNTRAYEQGFEKSMKRRKLSDDPNTILFDATPGYMRHMAVPCRIAHLWPDAKLIFLLR